MKKIISKVYIWVVLAFLILIIFVLPRIFQVLTFDELGLNVYMALFGILITAVITQLLLHTQASEQQKVEKNTKVYVQKLHMYKNFMDKVETLAKNDGESTLKDLNALNTLFMKMSMHMELPKLNAISTRLCRLCELRQEAKGDLRNLSDINHLLFEIALIMRVELYPDEATDYTKSLIKNKQNKINKKKKITDQQMLGEIIKLLSDIDGQVNEGKQSENEQLEEEKAILIVNQVASVQDIEKGNKDDASIIKPIDDAVIAASNGAGDDPETLGKALEASLRGIFANDGSWGIFPDIKREDNTCLYAYFPTQVVNMGKVFIGFHNEGGPEGWFFQCHLEFKDDNLRRQCYLSMRREFGGRMNKWCWWKALPQEWAKRLDGRVADPQLCQYVTSMVQRVHNWVAKYKRTMELYNELVAWKSDKLPSWKISIWENSICTISDSESPMSMDIKILHDNGGKREIWITNQQHDASVLQGQLKEAGVADTPNTNGNLSYFHKHNKNGKDMIFDDNESLEKELGELLPKLSKVRKD